MNIENEVGYLVAQLATKFWTIRSEKSSEYQIFPELDKYICFIDLSQSSNYRLTYGAEKGFVRSETFFAIIKEAIRPCPDVSIVKEIGDEVFLASSDFRQLLECVLLINEITKKVENVDGSESYPYQIRIAMGAGKIKKINRTHEDYLGSAIDQLSRLMSVRLTETNIVLHDTTDLISVGNRGIIEEYSEFLSIGEESEYLLLENNKKITEKIYYRKLHVNSTALQMYRKFFVHWR